MNSNKVGLLTPRLRIGKALPAIAGMLLCAATTAHANWEISPEIGVGLGFDDNARLSEVSGQTGNETFYGLDARAVFSYATERTDFDITPAVESRRFVDDSSLDSDDLSLRFDFNQDGLKSNFRFRGDIVTESVRTGERLDVNFDIEDPQDIGRDDTGQVIGNGERDRIQLNPEFSYEMTQRVSLNLMGYYQDTSYDPVASVFLADFQDSSITGSLVYDYSQKDTFRFFGAFKTFETDVIGQDSDSRQFGLGYTRKLSERTRLRFLAGADNTKDEIGVSQTNPVGEVALIHRYLSTTAIASYRRDVSGSGFGAQTILDTFNVNLSRQMSPKLTLRGGLRAYTTDALSGGDANFVKRDYTQVRASASWSLRRTMTLDFDYRFTHLKRSSAISEDNEDSNQVGLWLRWYPNPPSR